MSQVSKRKLTPKVESSIFDLFLRALAEMRNTKEARDFINDFFTPTERLMFTKRFAAVFLLHKEVSVVTVAQILKMSTSTVSRINVWFKQRDRGYRRLIERIVAKKKIKHFLEDIFKSFYYTGLPPKNRNWKEWYKNKREWERNLGNPLR
jgi:uncharacterized protein YerC